MTSKTAWFMFILAFSFRDRMQHFFNCFRGSERNHGWWLYLTIHRQVAQAETNIYCYRPLSVIMVFLVEHFCWEWKATKFKLFEIYRSSQFSIRSRSFSHEVTLNGKYLWYLKIMLNRPQARRFDKQNKNFAVFFRSFLKITQILLA